ncbi:hypothetical protein QQ045_014400 [Rhodiola kirilowii]
MKRQRTDDLQKDSDDGSSSVRNGGGVSTVPDPNRPQPDPNNDGADTQDGSSSVRSGGGVSTVPDPNRPQPDPNNDGANTQVQPRRKRGRPLGSTNKSKSPATRQTDPDNNDGVLQRPPKLEITRKPDPIMSPFIIEVANGVDVIDAISVFCKNYRETCLSILSVSGAVSKFKLHQLTPTTSSNLEFNGRFDILSLNATFITPSLATQSLIPIGPLQVTITVKDPEGQIIGGIVAEPLLIASGTVYITAALFSHPLYQRPPAVEELDEAARINATSSAGRNEQQSPSAAAEEPGEAARSINATSSAGRNEQQSPSAAAEEPKEAARSINATSSAGRNEQQSPSAAAEENNNGGGGES